MDVGWGFRGKGEIGSWKFCWVGEGLGGLDAGAKLIQVSLYHGDEMLAVATDKGRCKVREHGESVGIEGST